MTTKAKQEKQEKALRGRPIEHPYGEYAEAVIENLKFQDAGVGLSKSDLVDAFDPPLDTGVWNSLVRRMMQAGQITREGDKRGAVYHLAKTKAKRKSRAKSKAKTA